MPFQTIPEQAWRVLTEKIKSHFYYGFFRFNKLIKWTDDRKDDNRIH